MTARRFEVEVTVSAEGVVMFRDPLGLAPGEHRLIMVVPPAEEQNSVEDVDNDANVVEHNGLMLYKGPLDPSVDWRSFIQQIREERIEEVMRGSDS
jgi:hypothetical protein